MKFDWAPDLGVLGFYAPWDREIMTYLMEEVGGQEFWNDLARAWVGAMTLDAHEEKYGICMFKKSKRNSSQEDFFDALFIIMHGGESADEEEYNLDVSSVLKYLGDNFPNEFVN